MSRKARSRGAASSCFRSEVTAGDGGDVDVSRETAGQVLFGTRLKQARELELLLRTDGVFRGLVGPREADEDINWMWPASGAVTRDFDDARSKDDYTIREWVDAPGVRYVPVDGELELLPGLRLVPAPGHTRGMQVVVVETGGRPVVVGGDVAVWFGELEEPHTEGQLRVLALDPELVWLTHEHEPWRPRTV